MLGHVCIRPCQEEEEFEMSDEKKVSAETTAGEPAPKKKHWPIVVSVLAVIVIAVLVAFLHWHEEPSFCNTFCHQPMDYYVEGYYSEDPGLSASNHAEANVTCLGCHWSQAKMLDLVHEVVLFATDGFTNPLPDQKQFVNDDFCGGCHDGVTAPTKEEATAGQAIDPHNIPDIDMHKGIECGDCHSVHKQSTYVCAQCHADVDVPEHWATPANNEAQAATANWPVDEQTGTVVDPHNIPEGDTHAAITCASCHSDNTFVCAQCHTSETVVSELPEGWTVPEENAAQAAATEATPLYNFHSTEYLPFSEMHQTAGAMFGNEGDGIITCADCHAEKVVACAMCHLNAFEGNVPEGWTVPEHAMDVHGAADDAEPADDADAADDAEASADDAVTADGVADGEYTASGKGIGGDVPVTVTVKDGKISDVTVGDNSETQGIGSNAIEQLPSKIVEANGTDGVDDVSGATITSKAIKSAVNDALAQGK